MKKSKKQIKHTNKTFESIAENGNISPQNKSFFSKKNIIIISFSLVISIALLAVTLIFILKTDFSSLFSEISAGFVKRIGILWFSLLVLYMVFSVFTCYGVIWPRLKKMGYEINQFEFWMFACIVSFLRAVTPVLFSDPFSIYWLKSKGVSTSKATSIVFSNTLFWQIIQFTVTFPSFVMIACRWQDLIGYSAGKFFDDGTFVFTLLCISILIDAFSIAFMFMMNMSKSIHVFLSRIFNGIKKKLHMKYHTKEEVIKKYKEQATLKRDFLTFLKDWKSTAFILLLLALNEIVIYLAVVCSMEFVKNVNLKSGGSAAVFDIGSVFNCANVTFTTNRLNFVTPGGSGSLEAILKTYLFSLGDITIPNATIEELEKFEPKIVSNTILIWRLFGTYIPAVFGLGATGWFVAREIKHYKNNRN